MVLEKFVPRKPEKEVISMRISTDVLAQLDAKAAAFEISRNELINQCIAFALANMETIEE
jgi:predicted HicB family RNase H-like nuclease